MPRHIFTYGSLMFPQVWKRVTHGNYRSADAMVDGHARYAIVGETYPAMVAQADTAVPGVVYFDVDEDDIAILDAFEGTEYRREKVTAKIGADDMQTVEAYIYVGATNLSIESWRPETFQLQRFLDAYCPIPQNK